MSHDEPVTAATPFLRSLLLVAALLLQAAALPLLRGGAEEAVPGGGCCESVAACGCDERGAPADPEDEGPCDCAHAPAPPAPWLPQEPVPVRPAVAAVADVPPPVADVPAPVATAPVRPVPPRCRSGPLLHVVHCVFLI